MFATKSAARLAAVLAAACLSSLLRAEAPLPAPFDIPMTAAHPRNSEGSFAALKSGRIIYCYSQFYEGGQDDSPSEIAEMDSDDQGHTWSQPRIIVPTGSNRNVMSVSLLRLQSGKLALIYLAKRDRWLRCEPMMQISTDEAKTWGPATRIGKATGYFELNNDRAVQLKSGRIILPMSLYRTLGTEDVRQSWDSRAILLWYYSDDEGRTWTESSTWWTIPAASHSGLQEPGLVQLSDGSIFTWSRTDQGFQYGFHSTDNGATWGPPEHTELYSPESPASIKHLPNSDTLLAVFNDHSGRYPFPAKNRRTPLVAAFSTDNGKTWPVRQVIESDPAGWYCYTAIHYTPEGVLLAYCATTGKQPFLSQERIRLLPWSWLQIPAAQP